MEITSRNEDKISITTVQELEAAIIELKAKKIEQQHELSAHLKATFDSLKPVNILKHTLSNIIQPGHSRDTLLKIAGGIGTGLLTKGILGGKAGSMLGGAVSKLLKVGATTAFYSNADKLKAYGTAIYHNLFKKKSSE